MFWNFVILDRDKWIGTWVGLCISFFFCQAVLVTYAVPYVNWVLQSPFTYTPSKVNNADIGNVGVADLLCFGSCAEDISCWPSSRTLLLIRLWSLMFPPSDFRHAVMTPAILLMSEYLLRCPVTSARDVAIGSFICSLLLSVMVLSGTSNFFGLKDSLTKPQMFSFYPSVSAIMFWGQSFMALNNVSLVCRQ